MTPVAPAIGVVFLLHSFLPSGAAARIVTVNRQESERFREGSGVGIHKGLLGKRVQLWRSPNRPACLVNYQSFLRFGIPKQEPSTKRQRSLDDKPALTGRLAGVHVEHKPRSKYMDADDFKFTETTEDLVSSILDDHERELFDDELEDME